MLFNTIGFISILILLTPAMVYIYKSMYGNPSISHKSNNRNKYNAKRTANSRAKNSRDTQRRRVPENQTKRDREHEFYGERSRRVVNDYYSNYYDYYLDHTNKSYKANKYRNNNHTDMYKNIYRK